ncbi:hypothetical protein [Glycomyces albidus]|uniref:Uncharacterized protein n=1 Tax=Glycomyces albidus TaxID=2656774 RepID=A0A6L5G396_9ACTN|nr:hypothetical protein [Glycomyces albidus]MQM24140.1 hypothetical protein [Glycomyces albidus]
MRARPLVVAVLAALLSAACGESGAEEPDIAAEYVRSNQVLNDPFATESCCEDRMAQLAAMGSPSAVVGSVLGVAPCEDSCELNDAEAAAVRAAAGADADVYVRGMLVKHGDGLLEAASVLIARGEGNAVIVDADGGTYEDLDDFRAGNDLFEREDWLLVAEDMTSISGGGPIVTVTARTTPPLVWWLVGTGAAVVAASVAAVLVRARFRRRIGLAEAMRPVSPASPTA